MDLTLPNGYFGKVELKTELSKHLYWVEKRECRRQLVYLNYFPEASAIPIIVNSRIYMLFALQFQWDDSENINNGISDFM